MDAFAPESRTFVRGEGNYLYDLHQHRVFDAVSSIWTTIHGHCHPLIVEAISSQAARLDHATLLGAINPQAARLAERLCDALDLDYAFFASDGASAVEAALKMALQFWQNEGEPGRTRFVRLVDAYHGDTPGAMSLSDIPLFKSRFEAVTFETLAYGADPALLDRDDVAAVIVEPIVQAAAGMRVVSAQTYAPLRAMRPLLVVDEIATGFGRTGTLFAHEQIDLRPDIVCVGKGLTGGALALSASVVSQRVYDAFRGTHSECKHFFHGHSFSGNPIACAAALANLDLFEREATLERVQAVRDAVAPRLLELALNPAVREVRQAGLMIGIELRSERIDAAGAPTPAWRLTNDLYERGHFTRPIGEVIQLVPPLSSTADELHAFLSDLDELLAGS